MNPERFFGRVRQPLFGGRLTQPQVDGINEILIACRRERLSAPATAYVLATAYHESAHTMRAVREALGRSEAESYAKVTAWLKRKGRRNYAAIDRETGQTYLGRGLVQITHRANYEKASARLGVDLVGNPELALRPHLAARILVEGMAGGWFTGKKLSDYIRSEGDYDFVQARRIVNGLDKAQEIVGYAEKFLKALSA